jgi:hypothetical protein
MFGAFLEEYFPENDEDILDCYYKLNDLDPVSEHAFEVILKYFHKGMALTSNSYLQLYRRRSS